MLLGSARITTLMRAPLVTILTVAFASAGCDDTIVEVAVIETAADPAQIQVPGSVNRGELALVLIRSYSSMCMTVEDTDVSITADGAEITPYVRRPPGGCVAALVQLGHEAHVSFETLGDKTIVVKGRSNLVDPLGETLVEKTFTMTVVE